MFSETIFHFQTAKPNTQVKFKILVESAAGQQSEDGQRLINELGWIPLNDLVQAKGDENFPNVQTDSDQVIQIYFTSGTTGTPKMVPHTQVSPCHPNMSPRPFSQFALTF